MYLSKMVSPNVHRLLNKKPKVLLRSEAQFLEKSLTHFSHEWGTTVVGYKEQGMPEETEVISPNQLVHRKQAPGIPKCTET